MKKSILIVFFFSLICANYSQAQQYYPFATSNAFWRINWGAANCIPLPPPEPNHSEYQYIITGDTLIPPYIYHKLIRTGNIRPCADPIKSFISNTNPIGSFRNDTLNKKVFYLPIDSTNEVLLYDFNLSVGDTIHGYMEDLARLHFGPSYYAQIDSVDSVLINTNYRKRWHVKHYSQVINIDPGEIIEGIGHTNGLLEGFFSGFDSNGSLVCYSENGLPLYGSSPCETVSVKELSLDKRFSVSPNPTNNILFINTDIDYNTINIYSLSGKLVKTQSASLQISVLDLPKGMYFIQLIGNKNNVVQKFIKE